VLKSGSHPVDLALGSTVPCSYIAPLRDEFADLCSYFMGPVPTDIKPLILTTAINEDDSTASQALAKSAAKYFELDPAIREAGLLIA
jgi:hypothetical protein